MNYKRVKVLLKWRILAVTPLTKNSHSLWDILRWQASWYDAVRSTRHPSSLLPKKMVSLALNMRRDNQMQHRLGKWADISTFINRNLNTAWLLGWIIKLVSQFWGVIRGRQWWNKKCLFLGDACWNDWVKCITSASYFPTVQLADWYIHAVNNWKMLSVKRRVFSDKLYFAFSSKALRTHTPDSKFKNETTAPQHQICSMFLRDCF